MFRLLKPYLLKFSKKSSVAEGLEVENIKKNWEDAILKINRGAAGKTHPLFVNKNKELVVRVEDHLWLQEMSFYRHHILKKLAKNSKAIESIRFIM